MRLLGIKRQHALCAQSALTLVEVLVALMISGLTLSGIIYGYLMSSQKAEWSAYNLAAQSLALQQAEQCRAAKWDPVASPVIDFLANSYFPQRREILDIPVIGTNIVYATNTTRITNVSTNPPLRMISVECTWSFLGRGVFTNRVVTYRAPDQ